MSSMIAGHYFTWAARQFRDLEAVVYEDQRFTFRQLNARANRLANALLAQGVGVNDRVSVLLTNSMTSAETLIGIYKTGATVLPLNPRHTIAEHLDIVSDAEPVLIIGGPQFQETLGEIFHRAPSVKTVIGVGWRHEGAPDYETFLEAAPENEPGVEVSLDDICRMTYTSGTTGKPKGIVLSQRNIQARLQNFFNALEYGVGPGDAMIHVGPLTHAAANYMIPYYLRGARSIVLPHFDTTRLQETIHTERVNHLLLLPTMIIRLMDELQPEKYDLSCVTRINYGTAPMPVPVLRKAIAVFGPVFRGHYGLAEAVQPQTVLYPWEHVLEGDPKEVARLASCGRPIVGVDIRIRNDAGEELPAGEIGEITIGLGSNAIDHYWRRPEATAEAVKAGWLYTGDLGRMDEEGYLFIVGRKKDMIITGSYNVYAHEVEDALFRHPGILDAAVLGIPDTEWGESICAYIVPRSGATLEAPEVIDHCRKLIAGYKKPRFVAFIDEIPKNNNGKVDKNQLRERFLASHDQHGWEGDRTVQARY